MPRHSTTPDLVSTDPAGDRRTRKRVASEICREAMAAAGAVRAIVAAYLGCSEQRLAAELDPECERAPVQLQTVIGMPPLARRHVTEELAALDGYVLAECPSADESPRDALARHARLTREVADVVTGHAEAIADGRIDRAEATALRAEIREAQQSLASLDAVLELAEAEGVIGVVLKAVE